MRKNKIPKEARYERSVMKALEFVKVYDIQWFPVNPKNIFTLMNKIWLLHTVEETERISGTKNPFGVSAADGVDAKVHRRSDGIYVVVFDDKTLANRIRWTLAHEIGHIYLNHCEDFNLTSISKGDALGNDSITKEEYKVLEREAHIFAAEILSPMVVLLETNVTLRDDLLKIFLLSGEAAENRERDIKYRRKRYIYKYLYDEYLNQFSLFLAPVAFCANSNNAHNNNFIKAQEKVIHMNEIEPFAYVDQVGKFVICPKCGNGDFSKHALYCKMCGTYLFNECLNQPNDYDNGYCGKRNPGDARHCEYCGNETYLLKKGLIKSWEQIVAESGDIQEGINEGSHFDPPPEKPTDRPIDISDDDLPF